jgi:transposase
MPSSVLSPLELTDGERDRLESWTRRRTSAQALAMRSRIVLLAAAGLNNTQIAGELGIHRNVAGKWRARFLEHRLDGLSDEPRPGRPRTISDEQVEAVIVKTLETTPKDATHWSTRSMAREVGLTQSAVLRIWRAFGLQPHRQETWKLSKDPARAAPHPHAAAFTADQHRHYAAAPQADEVAARSLGGSRNRSGTRCRECLNRAESSVIQPHPRPPVTRPTP